MKSRLLFFMFFALLAQISFGQINSMGLIGSATPGGWDADTDMVKLTDSTWSLDITLINGAAKFRTNDSWDVNWGSNTFPTGTGTQGGADIPVFAGDYTVTFNSNSGFYNFSVRSDIGIIGDATPKGWAEDTDMYKLDSANYFTILDLTLGEVKFRKDNAWDVNWGSPDFPTGVGTQGGDNIKVTAAGKYRIELNIVTGAYAFKEVVNYTSIAIIGSATPGGWDNETPLTKDAANPDLWSGEVAIKEGEFKFRANNAWAISWGGDDFPSGTASLTGSNFKVPAGADGDYKVSFNTKSLEYKFLKIGNYQSIGIIGDATPGGWDAETQMIQDPTDRSKWNLRVKLIAGEAKFRANNNWDVSWGGLDFPAGVGILNDFTNIPIVAGDYKISFNSTTGEYNFEAVIEFEKISLVGKSGPFNAWPEAGSDARDTYLTKDPTNPNRWTLASVELTDFAAATDGGVKFRAEADWKTNWGNPAFPTGVATQDGKNIEPVAGTYRIDFRSDTGEYAFLEPNSAYDLLSSDLIKIYPNPSKDFVSIEINTDALKGDVQVVILNMTGQEVSNQKMFVNGKANLNVSNLQAGSYIVRISNSKNLIAKSLMIAR